MHFNLLNATKEGGGVGNIHSDHYRFKEFREEIPTQYLIIPL